MARATPYVSQRQLWLPDHTAPHCYLDSPAWFAWLATATSIRYLSPQRQRIARGYGPIFAPISLRKEARRHQHFWYAYRRHNHQLHKSYVGLTRQLTSATLERVAAAMQFF